MKDTDWVNLKLEPGFVSKGRNAVRRRNGTVEIQFCFQRDIAMTSYTKAATIPQDFLATGHVQIAVQGNTPSSMAAYASGDTLAVYSSAATASYFQGQAIYFTN